MKHFTANTRKKNSLPSTYKQVSNVNITKRYSLPPPSAYKRVPSNVNITDTYCLPSRAYTQASSGIDIIDNINGMYKCVCVCLTINVLKEISYKY